MRAALNLSRLPHTAQLPEILKYFSIYFQIAIEAKKVLREQSKHPPNKDPKSVIKRISLPDALQLSQEAEADLAVITGIIPERVQLLIESLNVLGEIFDEQKLTRFFGDDLPPPYEATSLCHEIIRACLADLLIQAYRQGYGIDETTPLDENAVVEAFQPDHGKNLAVNQLGLLARLICDEEPVSADRNIFSQYPWLRFDGIAATLSEIDYEALAEELATSSPTTPTTTRKSLFGALQEVEDREALRDVELGPADLETDPELARIAPDIERRTRKLVTRFLAKTKTRKPDEEK